MLLRLIVLSFMISLVACSSDAPPPQQPVNRIPRPADSTQKEIDQLRKEIEESTKYGRGETKDWEDRYLDHNPNTPYQGPTPGSSR
ncbi:MAG: hypothetical protein KDD66_05615 [Bdellovibrionales bacterium]|nr:hypothetical protein [Bdellovibrionales bacterium]